MWPSSVLVPPTHGLCLRRGQGQLRAGSHVVSPSVRTCVSVHVPTHLCVYLALVPGLGVWAPRGGLCLLQCVLRLVWASLTLLHGYFSAGFCMHPSWVPEGPHHCI